MLNELVLIFNSNVQSSETYYNATQSLHEFLTSIDLIKTFPQVSENLGDSLVTYQFKIQPNLRKASHQLFQAFIRTNGTFDPIISAMLSRGLVHHNVSNYLNYSGSLDRRISIPSNLFCSQTANFLIAKVIFLGL